MNSNKKYNKTAKAVDEAFLSILTKKRAETISIIEICEKAKINRSTFYLHYDNMDDLINEVLNYIEDVFNGFFNNTPKYDYKNLPLEDLVLINDTFLIPYLEFTKQYQFIYMAMVKNPEILGMDKYLSSLENNTLSTIFKRFSIPEKNQKYMLSYHINGISAIIETWINDNCKDNINEVAEIIKDCILGRNNKKKVQSFDCT